MDLSAKFNTHWKNGFSQLMDPHSRLLVTVSGGLDSVVLLDLLAHKGFNLVIAHCNFCLRGEESERDETFVLGLGEKYGREVLVKRFATKEFAAANKIAIQEAARELRYKWFASLINSWQATDEEKNIKSSVRNYIITAHHADDNIETAMMHFFRGSGLHGLTGIQPVQKERSLLRPLLPFRKKELASYAAARELTYVEDSSNSSDGYTRNFFRNRLIPEIKEIFPQVEENILQNINRFNEAEILYHQAVNRQIRKLVTQKDNELHIPILLWKKADPIITITWEIIKPYGFTASQTEEVIRLLDAENGAYLASPTHRIIRNRQWMIVTVNVTENAAHIIIEKTDETIQFEQGFLQIRNIKLPADAKANPIAEAWIDAALVKFPLLLRRWKQGDYFYPLGMQKKKKLARFLIDNKLSRTEKEKVWVLQNDHKIIWVIGYRIDDRYKITPQTTSVMSINYWK